MLRMRNLSSPRVRRGMVAVFVAVCLTVLMAVTALALDGGALMTERRHAQSVADTAALAAACDLYDWYWTNSGLDPAGTAARSALKTAFANGYGTGTNTGPADTEGDDDQQGIVNTVTTTISSNSTSKVTVNIPPASGYYANRKGYVEVLVEYTQTRTFSNIFSRTPLMIKARAVALGSPVAADVGILVLDPDDKGAFNAHGGGISTVDGTPIVVNSNHNQAAIGNGGGTLIAPEFFITGGYALTGGAQFVGDIYTNRPGMDDPLADLPPPNKGTMSVESTKKSQYTSGTTTLKPGVYQGGISVSGTGSLVLEPGIYYMDGGGFSFSGQGSLTGIGVMIYNDPGNGNSDGISVTGQGSMVLSGPTSGIYQGITFYQDRTSHVTGTVSGSGGQTEITGTFYFAGAHLSVSGNGGVANIGSQYISNTLELGGNGGINIDWQPEKVARRRSIYLVE